MGNGFIHRMLHGSTFYPRFPTYSHADTLFFRATVSTHPLVFRVRFSIGPFPLSGFRQCRWYYRSNRLLTSSTESFDYAYLRTPHFELPARHTSQISPGKNNNLPSYDRQIYLYRFRAVLDFVVSCQLSTCTRLIIS